MRFGSLIKLKPEYEEQYIILHKHTFPGVLDRIQKSNIRNYSIFLRDGLLFSYFEYIGNDYMGDMAKIGQDPVTQEWWKLTDPMQEPLETRKQGEWWASMEEIFHGGKKHMSGREVREKLSWLQSVKIPKKIKKTFRFTRFRNHPLKTSRNVRSIARTPVCSLILNMSVKRSIMRLKDF
jgi:L-rhamnose mutarotase